MNEHGYFESPLYHGMEESIINAYVAKVFGWMFVGLLVTAMTTLAIMYGINVSYTFANTIDTLVFGPAFILVLVVQVGIVIVLQARVHKMHTSTAKVLYLLYAASMGLTLGLITVLYAYGTGGGLNAIGMAFMVTALCFGVMSLYGLNTKSDLTNISNLLRMGLLGLIVMMIVNMFIGSGMLDFLICAVGLFIFLGLTAAKTNRIKNHFATVALQAETGGDEYLAQLASNLAIIGALQLYLSFVNMFMFILRLMGRRR